MPWPLLQSGFVAGQALMCISLIFLYQIQKEEFHRAWNTLYRLLQQPQRAFFQEPTCEAKKVVHGQILLFTWSRRICGRARFILKMSKYFQGIDGPGCNVILRKTQNRPMLMKKSTHTKA